MYFYTAYGLGIHSPIPLPGLVAVENLPKDVAIQLRKLDSSERGASRSRTYCLGEVAGIGTFLVRDGDKIIADPVPGVEESLLCNALLGPGMALLLRQRGMAVLHASGIAIGTAAVAFLGQARWGKSTLAETFYKQGYGVVTDDVMAVRVDGNYPQVIPAYPSVKLLPDAAAFLGCEASATHRVHAQAQKCAYSVVLGFPQGPLPLRRIYVLATGEDNKIEFLQPQEAFVELVRNSRAVSLLKDLDSRNAHLHHCSRLVATVPICLLKRRPVLTDLPEVVRLVEEDLAKSVY